MNALPQIGVLLLLLPACSSEMVTLGRTSESGASSAPVPKFSPPTLVAELMSDGEESGNPTLTGDLLEIFFTSEREGGAGDVDVWTARRATADEPFGAPEPVAAVNTDGFETSPAVSLDGLELCLIDIDDLRANKRASGRPKDLADLDALAQDDPDGE